MEFSRQEYWSQFSFPPQGSLSNPGIKHMSLAAPAVQADSSPLSHQGSRVYIYIHTYMHVYVYIYTHTVEYYSATRKKAILLFTTTWMEFEGISVQLGSVTQLCMILCDPMDCSMPGFPAHHKLLELVQTHVH